MQSRDEMIKVWDPIVRIGHWTLVLAFFTAYFTEDDFMAQHVWAGYVAGTVILVRLLWGFVGTRHARFSDFVRSPAAVLRYLRDLRNKSSKRYIGHNPAGGAMIIALLLSVSATVFTGLALYAVEDNAGPLAAWFADFPAPAALTQADSADRDRNEGQGKGRKEEDPREEYWEELHEFFTNLSLVLVALHVAGGLLSSVLYKENLVKAMFTGKKKPEDA